MKNSLRDFKLWQKKRGELPVADNKDNNWLEMHALLDKHMPVAASPGGWLRSKKLKTIALTFVSFSAAAMVYVASHVYELKYKNDKKQNHRGNHKHSRLRDSIGEKDSVAITHNIAERDTAGLSTVSNHNKIDSVSLVARSLTNSQNKADYTSIDNKSIKDSVSNGNFVAANGAAKNNAVSSDRMRSSIDKGSIDKRTDEKDKGGDNAAANNVDTKKVLSKTSTHKANSHSSVVVSGNSNSGTTGNNGLLSKSSRHSQNISNTTSRTRRGTSAINHHTGVHEYGDDVQDNKNNIVTSNVRTHRRRIANTANNKTQNADGQEVDDESEDNQQDVVLLTAPPKLSVSSVTTGIVNSRVPVTSSALIKKLITATPKSNKKPAIKEKVVKPKESSQGNPVFEKFNWGLLIGVNSSGSFTSNSLNSNFYGSSPIDFFPGVFLNYNINSHWAINSQLKIYSPQTLSYNYTHFNDGLLDSPKMQINSTRKIYSLELPLQLSYRVNNYLSIVAGPMINIPVKQAGISNKFNTNGVKTDSAYKVAVADTLSGTKYLQKLNFGISTGINIQYKRIIFGAIWNQSLTGYGINSGFGTYTTKPGTFQFTIGWQLDKPKLK